MIRFLVLLVALLLAGGIEAFVVSPTSVASSTQSFGLSGSNQDNDGGKGNPFGGFFKDFMSSVDDQVDDFFNKRMGNGEAFYGKRKSNPSGKVEGQYNGMGLTDKLRIDVARARKEAFLEEKERRRAEAEKRGL
ncbi:expressed unknown protein [Seminavis robusta]|uniref:Uncharacterized protein n=1 Tax=Seminavis robusta TaxID=568900 RepID=A0A9N8F1F4_9STRA|nr:expressed unknown protein [Seminavis robusta]|eukprot:Sro2787_g337070.1 n/a (134) ;mRNA; r:6732-7221